MELTALKHQIVNHKLDNVYIFTGDEVFVRNTYIKKIAEVSGLSIVYEDSVKMVVPKLYSNSMLQSNHCYVVFEDVDFFEAEKYWDTVFNAVQRDMLILVYANIDKRSKFYKTYSDIITVFEPLSEDILIKYIQHDIDLSKDNCKQLISICENNYSRILLELDKIKNYKEAMVGDCDINNVFYILLQDKAIYVSPEDDVFKFVDAVCIGDVTESFRCADDYKKLQKSPLAFISLLYNNMKQMLQVLSSGGLSTSDISRITGLSPWLINQIGNKLGAYTVGELVQAIRLLYKVDSDVKSGKIDQDIAIDYVLVNILGGWKN